MNTIHKEYTKSLKINNIWEAVIHSQDYKNKYDNCEDVSKLQKEVFKNYVMPKIEDIVNDTIKNNNDYWKIEISNIKGKYTKNEKYINIELFYNNNHEIINIVQILLDNCIRDIKNILLDYGIYY